MWRSSFFVNLQACRLIADNFTNKWTPSRVFFDRFLSTSPPCPLHVLTQAPRHHIFKSPLNRCGGEGHSPPCSISTPVWNPASTLVPPVWNFFFSNNSNCHANKIVIWLFWWNSLVHWNIPEKLQTGWVVDILFWNPPSRIFRFVTLPLEILEKASFHPWKFRKIVCHPLEIPRSITKTQENFTIVFLYKIPINSTSFLIGPWDFHVPFLQNPWSGNSMYSTRDSWLDFSWNSPSLEMSSVKLQPKCSAIWSMSMDNKGLENQYHKISSLEFGG